MASADLLALITIVLFLALASDGYDVSKRIVGGIRSSRGEWPWLVSLHMVKREPDTIRIEKRPDSGELPIELIEEGLTVANMDPKMLNFLLNELKTKTVNKHQPTFEGHMCAGSLINEQWIVSAKHCFNKLAHLNLTDDPDRWTAELGEFSLSGIDGHERSHKISKIIMHEPVDSIAVNDIALIKLEEPTLTTEHIRPISLADPDDNFSPGMVCTVAGWGHTSYGGEMSDEIMHIRIPLLPREECPSWSNVGKNELCAGGGSQDACQYDSGGPLVCRKNGVHKQLGIVSRGRGCGEGHPGIYTDVRGHLKWILETIDNN